VDLHSLFVRHIWIQTSHAWYILEEPDPEYHDMFQQALRPHALLTRLLHVVRQDPAVDLHTIDWATVLPHPALADIHSYDFCSDDNLVCALNDQVPSLTCFQEAELRDIVESSEQDYDDWPARIHRILGTSKGSRGKGRQIRPDRLPKSAKARTFTATPLVAHIVKDYFAEGELNEIQMPGIGEDHHERAPASAPVAHPRCNELKVIIPRVRDSDALQWISIGGVKYMVKCLHYISQAAHILIVFHSRRTLSGTRTQMDLDVLLLNLFFALLPLVIRLNSGSCCLALTLSSERWVILESFSGPTLFSKFNPSNCFQRLQSINFVDYKIPLHHTYAGKHHDHTHTAF
jgi:hypothetical protein